MPVIVVANPKGGVGKSTLASNIAGLFASRGHRVMLGDVDRQQSARRWLAQRPETLPRIEGWDVDKDVVRPPKGVSHVVMDTPAGLHGKKLGVVHQLADRIIVPLQPSLFDIQATYDFIHELREVERESGRKVQIGMVGMRAREGLLSVAQLHQFLGELGVPVLGLVRDTQNYVQLAARGLTIWDVAPGRVQRDLAQWEPIAHWLLG